jgi:hypothetical protein
MPEPQREQGDPALHALFEEFHGQLVSPGGAAALLGVSRKTIYTLGQRGKLRVYHGPEQGRIIKSGPKWTYIPLVDVAAYAKQVGRPFPKGWEPDPEA